MLIDFHTHTSASDGALDPSELVARALSSKIDFLAITDHDTMAGYKTAAAYHRLNPGGMRLIPGVEFSCQWSGTTIHILGLGVDCDHPTLARGLVTLASARQDRAAVISSRLAARGFDGALQGAQAQAGNSQLGRPHFAAWMVKQGYVKDHSEAFDRYLGQGKTGDVKAYWPQLAEVVQWVAASGGTAVIAHPLKYRFTGMKLRRLVAAFMEAGGRALEVHSGRQTRDQIAHLTRLAVDCDLEVSIGSDFHRDSTYGAPLGVESVPFKELRGVWERWAISP